MPRERRFPRQGLQDLQLLQASIVCVHCRQLVPLSRCSTVLLIPLGFHMCRVLHPRLLLPLLSLASLLPLLVQENMPLLPLQC